jgi:hypothetical protein
MQTQGGIDMTCPFARFVVHYKDGTTITEDRSISKIVDGRKMSHWDLLSKQNISAMGILYDPISTGERDKDGKTIRIRLPEYVLKGSKKYNYRFFQLKDKVLGPQKYGKNGTVLGIIIGMIIDPEGHCVVKWGTKDGTIKTAFTTVHSLNMDRESLLYNYDINLEECGAEIGKG